MARERAGSKYHKDSGKIGILASWTDNGSRGGPIKEKEHMDVEEKAKEIEEKVVWV